MSGSITSRIIRWGLKRVTADSASCPVEACSTEKPWKRSAIVITSTMFSSSSTTRMRWPVSWAGVPPSAGESVIAVLAPLDVSIVLTWSSRSRLLACSRLGGSG